MKRSKLLSVLLALAMVLSLLPTTALAAEGDGVTCTEQNCGHVAETGGKHYTTLHAAVLAVTEGSTVTLLKDATGGGIGTFNGADGNAKDTKGQVKIPAKSFTIDFNAHTYTLDTPAVGSKGYMTQGFHLEWKGNNEAIPDITFKNGTIAVAESCEVNMKMAIQNYCNLTLDGMTIDGMNLKESDSQYVVSNNCGNTTIKNTKIIAKDGFVAFDVCRYGTYPSVSVTVEGNSVINGNVEIYGSVSEEQSRQLTIHGGTFNGAISVDDSAKSQPNITINSGAFTDLANAVKYAAENANITLAADASGDGIVIQGNQKVTIDLNQHTYSVTQTVGSAGTKTNQAQFLKGAVVTIKNGTFVCEQSKIGIKNYADLTLENVVMKNVTGDPVVNNCGTLTVNGENTELTSVNGAWAITTGNYWNGVIVKTTVNAGRISGIACETPLWKIKPNADSQVATVDESVTTVINGGTVGTLGTWDWRPEFPDYQDAPLLAKWKMEVNGGTFAALSFDENAAGKVSFKGGTFATDPSAYVVNHDTHIVRFYSESSYAVVDNSSLTSGTYLTKPHVAEGYKAIQSDGMWTVSLISSSPSNGSGSSSGSSSSSSSSSSSGSTSASTTVTVPVSSDAGSVNVKAEVSKGNATVEISDKQIEQVAANGSGTVTVDVSELKKVESVQVPAHVVDTTNKAENTSLTVALPDGSVALDETALESVTTGEDVIVSVQKVPATDLTEEQQKAVGDMANIGLVVDVDLFVGKEKQSAFNGGKLTISVPYTPKRGEDTSKLTVWFIRDDGTIENMGGYYDAAKGCFVFETDHLSRYVLVYDDSVPTFTDVPEDAYFAGAVAWAVQKGVTGGVTDTTFAPYSPCTRAQIVTFLYRYAVNAGLDVSVGEDTNILSYNDAFDVPEYAIPAFQWAVGAGITQGNNGNLMPNQTCTRAQAVAFLYRFAALTGMDAVTMQELVSGFGDASQVPGYALAPFNWALANGIVQGNGGNLMPNQTCTRAQIVTFLYRAFR